MLEQLLGYALATVLLTLVMAIEVAVVGALVVFIRSLWRDA